MKILLLVSAFNGLTQRAWCGLREAGHEVSVELAIDEPSMIAGVRAADPDLILCPFLKERVPAGVWQHWTTIIIHPGPVGDRGPSSLDHAIMRAAPRWGVTALQAVEEMDAGPIWAARTFAMPAEPPRKSALYNGPVADAAMECIFETVAKAADPSFRPTPLAEAPRPIPGTGLLPVVRQADRQFDWSEDAAAIVRRIRAADGAPGVRTRVATLDVHAYDATQGPCVAARPGTVIGRRGGAVLVAAGLGSVWLGQLRPVTADSVKLPATTVLNGRLRGVRTLQRGPVDVGYVRRGQVGEVAFHFYNGAFSTGQCRRLAAALRHAAAQDTRVLLLRGGIDAFSNGIHLGAIHAAPDPAAEAWANIRAINAVCRRLLTNTRQVVVTAFSGNAGAGGVMLGLGGDVTAARADVVLNPYYEMGLFGSELHTYALPQRIGAQAADRLLADRLPVDAAQAHRLGLVDAVGPRVPTAFYGWLTQLADEYTDEVRWKTVTEAKARRVAKADRPLSYFETVELAEMARDIFDDRNGFAAARTAFVQKRRPAATPDKLALHRP
jgi:putative two-component system hydrogenase maturation factor HypX/HoxX